MSIKETVDTFFERNRERFINYLRKQFENAHMGRSDAEDIYADVYLAIHNNLQAGQIREDTNWSAYIFRIGYNMACKKYRREQTAESIDGDDRRAETIRRRVDECYRELIERDSSLLNDPTVDEYVSEELEHTPEPCSTMIQLFYHDGMSDRQIAEFYSRRGDTYSNPTNVRVKRWQCVKSFVYRVRRSLYHAGILEECPERS